MNNYINPLLSLLNTKGKGLWKSTIESTSKANGEVRHAIAITNGIVVYRHDSSDLKNSLYSISSKIYTDNEFITYEEYKEYNEILFPTAGR